MTKHPFIASKVSLALFLLALPAAQIYGASKTLHKRSAQAFATSALSSSSAASSTSSSSTLPAATITSSSVEPVLLLKSLSKTAQDALKIGASSSQGKQQCALLLPDNKHCLKSYKNTISIVYFDNQKIIAVECFKIPDIEIHTMQIVIADGKGNCTNLNDNNRKNVSKDWKNCRLDYTWIDEEKHRKTNGIPLQLFHTLIQLTTKHS